MLPKDFNKLTSKQYLGLIADLGCFICKQPAEIHHNTKNRAYGAKSSDFLAIPLCPNHHRGQEGIHHIGVLKWEAKHGGQNAMSAEVKEMAKESLKSYI